MNFRRVLIAAVLSLFSLPLLADADLSIIAVGSYVQADPAAPFARDLRFINLSTEAASQVEVTVDLPVGSTFLRGDGCTATGLRVVCAAGDLAGGAEGSVRVELVTPAQFEGVEVPLAYAVHHAGSDPRADNNGVTTGLRLYRTFVVDSVADDGPGSLRQAITQANLGPCWKDQQCRITFRFAAQEGTRWYTIRPLSPLPTLVSNYTGINGEIQTWLTGDTNPAGPEIELNGSLAGGGNGLLIDSVGDMVICGLVINGWAENGISFFHPFGTNEFLSLNPRVIRNNYIGTDPTGSFAVPNGLRGIASSGGSGQIIHNVLSGNARSGIYFYGPSGSTYTHEDAAIVGNRIGVKANSDEPLPNGMAGIFLGPEAGGIDVTDNVIGYNLHFGVAVASVTENRILRNRIFGHDIAAIDIGIDGPTPVAQQNPFAPVPIAVLTSARYDAATDSTIVEGHPFASPNYGYSIELFSSALGRADADRYLGTSTPNHDKSFFTMTIPGDLRGKAITATLTRVRSYGWLRGPRTNELWQGMESHTSELSAPIEVK